ncbi:MAG: DUF2334 domain-containing protein [Desulfitobacteriaceae bacterium]
MKKIIAGLLVLGLIAFVVILVRKENIKSSPTSSPTLNDPKSTATINYANFPGLSLAKDDIKLRFQTRDLNLSLPIYYEVNHYYLPVTEILAKTGGKQVLSGNSLRLELGGISRTINLQNNTYLENEKVYPLRKPALVKSDIVYLSLFDWHKLFNLKVNWDIENKTLTFYPNRDKAIRLPRPQTGKPALIRLEDISATHYYSLPDSLEKLRIIADYLYSENVPFHVAWVPRYIDPRPATKADVDISKQYSMDNANFVYTLDYMLDDNGLIGLHGYTHQYGNTESIDGVEFHTPFAGGTNIPTTDEYALDRVNSAKDAAQRLGIPYTFFEVPHYAAYGNQLKVIEKNFDIIYEYYPGAPNQITVRKNGDKNTKYIPTPLDYVDGKKDLKRMIDKIQNLKPNVLASFFYHPYIDFDSIKLSKDADGYPTYTYADNSPLHQLIQVFKDKGYRFEKITDIN